MGGKGDIDISGGGGADPRDDYARMNAVLDSDFPVFSDGAGEIEELHTGGGEQNIFHDGTYYYFQSIYTFNDFPGIDGFFGFSNDITYAFDGRKSALIDITQAGDWYVDFTSDRVYSYGVGSPTDGSYVHMCERQVEIIYGGPWTFILDTWPLATRLPEVDTVTPGRLSNVQVVNFNEDYLVAHASSGGPPFDGSPFSGQFRMVSFCESQDAGLDWDFMPTTFPTPTPVGAHGSPHIVSELNPPPNQWLSPSPLIAIGSSIYTYAHDGNRDTFLNNIGKYYYWFRRSFGPLQDWEKAENREWWTDYYDAKFPTNVTTAYYRWNSPTGMLWGTGIDVMSLLSYRDGGNYYNDSSGGVHVTDVWAIDGWGLKPAADLSDGSLLWTLPNVVGKFLRAQTHYDFDPFPPTITPYYIIAGETFITGIGQVWNKQGSNAATLAWSSADEPDPSEYTDIADVIALSTDYMLMVVRYFYNTGGSPTPPTPPWTNVYYYRIYESRDFGQSFQLLSQINFHDLFDTPSVGWEFARQAQFYKGFRILNTLEAVISFKVDDGYMFLYSPDAGVTWNLMAESGLPDDPWIMSHYNSGDGRVFTEFTGDPILMQITSHPGNNKGEQYATWHKKSGESKIRFQVTEDLFPQEVVSVFDAEIRESDIVGSLITCDSAGFTIRADHINELRRKLLQLNSRVQTGGTNRVNFGIDVSDLPTVVPGPVGQVPATDATAIKRDHYYVCKRETDNVIGQVGTAPGSAYYCDIDLTEFSLLMPDPVVDEEVSIRTLIGMRKTLQSLYSDGFFCACYSYCPCQTDIDINISGSKK